MKKRKNIIADNSAQVAIEFILMFIVVGYIVFYIWRLGITITGLQLREYATFMVGRAVTASFATNQDKIDAAKKVMETYNKSAGFAIAAGAASPLVCNLDGQAAEGNRSLFGKGLEWNVASDVGVLCGMKLSGVVPVGDQLDVVSESLTWSEMSDGHCKCALPFNATWRQCVRRNESGEAEYIDNGC